MHPAASCCARTKTLLTAGARTAARAAEDRSRVIAGRRWSRQRKTNTDKHKPRTVKTEPSPFFWGGRAVDGRHFDLRSTGLTRLMRSLTPQPKGSKRDH